MKKLIILIALCSTVFSTFSKPKVKKKRDTIRIKGYEVVRQIEVLDDQGKLTEIRIKCDDPGSQKCKQENAQGNIYNGYNATESEKIDEMFDYSETQLFAGVSNGTHNQTFTFVNVETGVSETWLYNVTWSTNTNDEVTEEVTTTLIN